MNMIAIIFKSNPALAIWGIDNWPLARTLALGPVPEGSINAHEAAIVAGIINKKKDENFLLRKHLLTQEETQR